METKSPGPEMNNATNLESTTKSQGVSPEVLKAAKEAESLTPTGSEAKPESMKAASAEVDRVETRKIEAALSEKSKQSAEKNGLSLKEILSSDEGSVRLDLLFPRAIADRLAGRTTEESMNPDGTSALITRDKKGREVSRIERDFQGRETGVIEVQHDKDGSGFTRRYLSPQGELQKEERSYSFENYEGDISTHFRITEYDSHNPESYIETHLEKEGGPVEKVKEVRVEGLTRTEVVKDSEGVVQEGKETTYRTGERKSVAKEKDYHRPGSDPNSLEVCEYDFDAKGRQIKKVRTLKSEMGTPKKTFESSTEYFDDGTEVEVKVYGNNGEKIIQVRASEMVRVSGEWMKRDIDISYDKDGKIQSCSENVTIYEEYKDYMGRKGFRPVKKYTAVDFSKSNETETRESTKRVRRIEYDDPSSDYGQERHNDPEAPEVRVAHKPLSEVSFETPDSLRRKLKTWLTKAKNPREKAETAL